MPGYQREKNLFSRRAGTFLRETLYSCQSDLKLGYKTTIEEKKVLDFGYWQEFFPRENRGSQAKVYYVADSGGTTLTIEAKDDSSEK